ncbi:ALK tyrosine kinase receptor-like [Garra rufa]|uniref:ALK tyrosine kinase receptor-like n=1 Tax=Garra rufa TaxID=137080 RepID=UPI003CCE71FB
MVNDQGCLRKCYTLSKGTSQNVTLRGRYHCRGGREINVSQLCDFNPDCPQGDDEGEHCRQFLNGSYCSFGREDCGWQLVPGRGPQWRAHPSIPQSLRSSCPSPGALLAIDSQPKGQRGSAQVRSPLFFYPLRNAPCMVKFWVCGSSNGVLSLWIIENSTGPEGQRSLWNSTSEANMGKGWKLITLPLFGLVDLFYLQFSADISSSAGTAFAVDNFTLSMECFLETNGEFPPVAPTSPTQVLFTPSSENIKTTTALYGGPGASTEYFSDGVLITQWPKYISNLPGSSVEMHCYQNDTDYNYKFWYRQIKEELVLIGSYIVNSASNEKGFENGFEVSSPDKKKWTLKVDVKEGFDAVYLCAASLHSE